VTLDTPLAISGFFLSVTALLVSFATWRMQRLRFLKEATETEYDKWWSKTSESTDLRTLEDNFFKFLEWRKENPKALRGKSLKDDPGDLPYDNGRLQEFVWYFDKIGWLGGAGLLDLNYVTPPMQHWIRRVWWATAPLIETERSRSPGQLFDPVYCYGFQWLYQRTCKLRYSQWVLMLTTHMIPIRDLRKALQLRQEILKDERWFRKEYGLDDAA